MKDLIKLQAKIKEITAAKTPVIAAYRITDSSVQAELRLAARWRIRFPVDEIHAPKDLSKSWPQPEPWQKWHVLERELSTVTAMGHDDTASLTAPINERTKSGPARRAEAREAFELKTGNAFLAAHCAATTKTALKRVRAAVERIQTAQKAILPEMRALNSAIIMGRRNASQDRRASDQAALTSGRFWEASKDALKDYFHPPFSKNHLADVSERWRAALYTEMDSTAWKAGKGDWRHKNIGTGRAYLCGIDDNGDEWGHRVDLTGYMDQDEHGDLGYVATVEDAMSVLFDIARKDLTGCQRQGDLLFCPAAIPETVEFCREFGPWEIRESHAVESPGLYRNGHYLTSLNDIEVTHTSHEPVTLPAGSYRLYELQVEDAD